MSIQELVPLRKQVCLPGDPVLLCDDHSTVIIGDGLYPRGPALLASYCAPVQAETLPNTPAEGHAEGRAMKKYFLASPATRRYEPRAGDPVIATICRRQGQRYYLCSLQSGVLGYLESTSFDGATKTNLPRLVEGDLVYCHVRPPHKENYLDHTVGTSSSSSSLAPQSNETLEVELSCMAAEVGLPAKAWTSGEAHFGPLTGGQLLSLSLPYVRSLLTPPTGNTEGDEESSYLLELLAKECAFEAVIGLNGQVFIKGASHPTDPSAEVRRTIAVCACLTEGQQDRTRLEMEARVSSYFNPS